jgi:hypothetical protein
VTTLEKAAAVAGALTLAAVVAGVATREGEKVDPVSTVGWEKVPTSVTCDVVTVLDEKAGTYSTMEVCDATPTDGGKPQIPADAGLVEFGARVPSDGGTFRLERKAEHACACSSGANCEVMGRDGGWQRAPALRLEPGRWRGAGCVRMPCAELWRRDVTSWPQACPGG